MADRHGVGFVCLFLIFVGVLMAASMDSARAYKFYAGGRDGWVLHPSESYQDWSSRNRFQVDDTVFFRYHRGQDSVLVVTKQQFDACDTSNPIARLDDGDSQFKFDRPGPFYFISGVPDKCLRGQKLLVVVMGVRRRAQPPVSLPPSSSLPPTTTPAPSPVNPTSPPPSPSSLPEPSAVPPSQGPSAGGVAVPPAQPPSESDTSHGGGAASEGLKSVPALSLTMMISVVAVLGY